MEINITLQQEEKLLSRQRIEFEVANIQATPSLKDVRLALAKQLSLNPDTLIVRHLRSMFGYARAKGLAFHYQSLKALKQLENATKIKKNGIVLEKPKQQDEQQPKKQEPEKPEQEQKGKEAAKE
ncbi:hypothetical protein J7L02_03665 [Candidatus Woesearchaeota archaeon]|nr:hypothetical protein [Candidatus Woesearchaeota archaeon]